MKKIVVTGATSMIGEAITRCALNENMEVLCIVRKNTKRINNLPKSDQLKFFFAELSEYSNITISDRYDIFYHLAWEETIGDSRDDVDIQQKNIQYTLDSVRLAERIGCKAFIGAGSQAEYGIVTEPVKPETAVNPESGYGVAKYAAGKLSKLLCSQIGLKFNWVRIVSAFGPLDLPKRLIIYVIKELQACHSPELTKCEQIWDYIYCDDVAKAFIAVGNMGIDGKSYTLGSGRPRLLSDYLESVKKIANPDIELKFGGKDYYPHQPMYLCADISELTNDTGWKPEISFEDGIRKVIDYLSSK